MVVFERVNTVVLNRRATLQYLGRAAQALLFQIHMPRQLTFGIKLLVTDQKYPKMGGIISMGANTHRCFAIYFFNPCFRILIAWNKYS